MSSDDKSADQPAPSPSSAADNTLIPQLPRQKFREEIVFDRPPLNEDNFTQMIRQINLKVTNQRLVILKALHAGRQHMTAQEVFEKVKATDPHIGFATVYRFLKKLASCSLVTELRMGGLPARYELTSSNHHDHITCLVCGTIVEFENQAIEELQEAVARKLHFSLKSHILELYGECADCRKIASRKK